MFELFGAFLKLGLTSFGGPVAHIGYFRDEFVRKRHWLDDAAYADLVALCQFLPGPASSQMVFALGMQQAGLVGAIIASLCFTLPSAMLMILFGYGVSVLGDLHGAGWLHGLKLAAVAVVAQAVWGMGHKLCPDRTRLTVGLLAAALLLVFPGALTQIGVIAGGAAIGWWLYRKSIVPVITTEKTSFKNHYWAIAALALFALLLVLLPWLASVTRLKSIAVFDSFYRAGSLVFGGGHVVLPLLRAEVVPPGWLSDDTFLAGYGAAQALPGPLFTFSAYLGTVMQTGSHAWLLGTWCLIAVFLPGWLLIGGALPFWHQLRSKTWTQAALQGANAAVVGLLLAALYNPVWIEGIRNVRDFMVALVAFTLLQVWNVAPWMVVLVTALVGEWMGGR
jgi:chromate transporter